jgi:hypothetical protein
MPTDKVSSSALPHHAEAVGVARKRTGDASVADERRIYSSRIIKAGALLADTTTLLAHWNNSQSTEQNLAQLQRENVFGKASRSRIADVLAIFRQRYLREKEVARALSLLVHNRMPKPALDRIFYFHAAIADRLLNDTVTELLADYYANGRTEIRVDDLQRWLTQLVYEDKTSARWSDDTTRRVAQGLLSTLRDFGILEGANNKRIAPPSLPVSAFSYIAFYLRGRQASGELLIQSKAWQLFFLSPVDVERYFMEAHQHRLLEYYAAGPVVRITFPSSSLEDYSRVISERQI